MDKALLKQKTAILVNNISGLLALPGPFIITRSEESQRPVENNQLIKQSIDDFFKELETALKQKDLSDTYRADLLEITETYLKLISKDVNDLIGCVKALSSKQ